MKNLLKRLPLLIMAITCSLVAMSQGKKLVTGSVKDASGAPVVAATVNEKGTKNSTLTDNDGNFQIRVANNSRLVISYVGYTTQEFAATSDNLKVTMNIDNVQSLDDVVVTALGIQKQKRSLGYATTTVKSEELIKTAPTNFAAALYGKAPGVRIASAPGGSLAGVSINIRGLGSITGNSQPLIIMDGAPIKNGDFSNNDYWGDQRIRGNGLVDINPEDIESVTVLKGASAAALYGAEARNGVILLTTKSGKAKKGFSVDFNTSYFQDDVAYLIKYQDVRGAGVPTQFASQVGLSVDANGFNATRYNIGGTDYRALLQASINYGPQFDGQPIATWTGNVVPYSAIKDGRKNLYQKANNGIQNLAFAFNGNNVNSRFSFTHQRYEGVSLNSSDERYNFSSNTNFNFGKKARFQLVVNDIYSKVTDRPYSIDRMVNNFAGMMPVFDDGQWYQDKAVTSLGYAYVTGKTTRSLTPDENIYIPNYRGDILDYMWRVKMNHVKEDNNRLLASGTFDFDLAKNLSFRAKLANDWSYSLAKTRNYSNIPTVYGYSGYYGVSDRSYNIMYGDLLMTYDYKVNHDLDLKVMGGYTASKESGNNTSSGTSGGLTTANRFDMTSSANALSSGNNTNSLVKDAFMASINASFKNYLFVEGTVRRDRYSTMNPDNNAFVYPSINASLVLSEMLKLPTVINYSKLRAAYGMVGRYPAPYQANVSYSLSNLQNQGSGSSTLITSIPTGSYGNDNIKPETKKEYEIGLETRLLRDKLNIDIAYYHAMNNDLILPLQIAQTSGANSVLSNVGSLLNTGVDLSINATPVSGKNFKYETGINFNFNKNKIVKLADGSSEITFADYDGNAAVLKAVVGQAIGDLYAHPILTDGKGNNVIYDWGGGELNYKIDGSKLEKYGNVQPKAIGGFYHNFNYKNFGLDLYTDFRIGGYVMPTGLFWMTSRGLTEASLYAMDKAHGGVSYYRDSKGNGIETTAAAGPNGEKVYNDGIKMGGVFADGTPNNYVTSQFFYFWDHYNWGGPQYSNSWYFKYILENTYWKMREVSLSYTFSKTMASKIKANKLQLSVFGRNLFYLYRTIKDMDAEQLTVGTDWRQQINNAGSQPATRSYGISLRASF